MNNCTAMKLRAAMMCLNDTKVLYRRDSLEDDARTDCSTTIGTGHKIEEVATLVRAMGGSPGDVSENPVT